MRPPPITLMIIIATLLTSGCSSVETTNRNMKLGNVGIDCNGADYRSPDCMPDRNPNNSY